MTLLRRPRKKIIQFEKPGRAPVLAAKGTAGSSLGFIPADPLDPRLKVTGAVCGTDGKIDISAYEDIMDCWTDEPPPQNHADPLHPGVRSGEEIPKGLRAWKDSAAKDKANGGWTVEHIGAHGKKQKMFSIRACGSWRLAFLLARLQNSLWEIQEAPPRRVPVHLICSPKSRRLLRRQSSNESSTGKRLLRRHSSVEQSPAKRLRRQKSDEGSAEKERKTLPREQPGDDSKFAVNTDKLWPGQTSESKLKSVQERILARIQAKERAGISQK